MTEKKQKKQVRLKTRKQSKPNKQGKKPKKIEKIQQKKKQGEIKELKIDAALDKETALKSFEIVMHPLVTEKSIGMIESENKLVFIVKATAQKSEVKKAVEDLYAIKVDKVNILMDSQGRKRAFVKINKQFRADEIATKLGVL